MPRKRKQKNGLKRYGHKGKSQKLTLNMIQVMIRKMMMTIANKILNALSRNWSLNSGAIKIHISNRKVTLPEMVGS